MKAATKSPLINRSSFILKGRIYLGAVLLALIGVIGFYLGASAALAVGIEGSVNDLKTKLPIPDARVEIPSMGLSTTTDENGKFVFRNINLRSNAEFADITTTATGYADWVLQDAILYSAETLVLRVELGDLPQLLTAPRPRAETPDWPAEAFFAEVQGSFDPPANNEPIPSAIRVRITGDVHCDLNAPYTVETIPFNDYVKHVLPNEWIPSWPGESLRAGAMAAKMYAWYYVSIGGKWPDADVYDSTCDQVYNPAIRYESTDLAVDFTWNWRLLRNDALLRTSYRAWYSQCVAYGLAGNCIGQWDTYYHALGNNGYDLLSWDEMLSRYYLNSELEEVWLPPGGYSLRFQGNGYGDLDRVKIPIDPPVPADIGGEDFTVELWLKANPGENGSGACSSAGDAWRSGNIILDRAIHGDGEYGEYGMSLANGRIAFGVSQGVSNHTICGSARLDDSVWHHVAVTRDLDGVMRIFVDGQLDAEGSGPTGDISYQDGRITSYPDDPFLVIAAEKHDQNNTLYPSFSGWLDEIRISNTIRYSISFTPPASPFVTDGNTVALYHLNEGYGNIINDTSNFPGGPSDGFRIYGGVINGPEWSDDTRWHVPQPTPTPTPSPTSTATPIFEDVPFDHWAHDYIAALHNLGYIVGCSLEPSLYCPENILDRAESAVFVLRGSYGAIQDPPHPPPPSPTFMDVDQIHWAYEWIESLAVDGFTAGCSSDPHLYCPNQEHTRAEGSVFFLRIRNGAEYTPPDSTGIFQDVDPSIWYADWIEAAYNQGLLLACQTDPLLICPDDLLDRAWAAYMLVQAKEIPIP